MDIYKQNKLLIWGIVLLVLLNLTSIGVFLWKEVSRPPRRDQTAQQLQNENERPQQMEADRPRPEKNELANILKEELSLDDSQVEKLKKLRRKFFEKEEELIKVIKSERDSMNAAMFNKEVDEKQITDIARRISENEFRMEMLRFEQAKEFRSICTPEQLEKFDELIKEIRDYFKPNNKPPKK